MMSSSTDMPPRKQTAAVVGLGGMGIVTVKNLIEEGFDVSGFERSSYVGGLWHYTDDKDTLSVLPDTQANVSTDRASYTDYPFPEGTPHYCHAKEIEDYLENYVDHFGLRPRCHLNTSVTHVTREDDSGKWRLDFESQPSQYFDKVVMATGPHVQPTMPDVPGLGEFKGQVLHSQHFKTAKEFKDKDVVLLGLGNSTGDIANALVGVASTINICHNRGSLVLPRLLNGVPCSRAVTQRRINAQGLGEKLFPNALEKVVSLKAKEMMNSAFGPTDPSWGLDPFPSLNVSVPIVSDSLIQHLRDGAIGSLPGIVRVVSPSEFELTDSTVIEADVVICCTGYQNNFGLLDSRFDPSANPPEAWTSAPGAKDRPLPRLYQNVFSLQHPGSLAFLGCAWFATGAFCLADLASMAIAQVWSGKSQLPPQAEMERWADGQERRVCALAQRGAPVPASVPQREWLMWADRTAGAGVFDRLGWGCAGWQFWWRDKELCKLMMDGVLTSVMWRVFDEGKRKPWHGAREEILRVNNEANREAEALKRRAE